MCVKFGRREWPRSAQKPVLGPVASLAATPSRLGRATVGRATPVARRTARRGTAARRPTTATRPVAPHAVAGRAARLFTAAGCEGAACPPSRASLRRALLAEDGPAAAPCAPCAAAAAPDTTAAAAAASASAAASAGSAAASPPSRATPVGSRLHDGSGEWPASESEPRESVALAEVRRDVWAESGPPIATPVRFLHSLRTAAWWPLVFSSAR